MARDPAWLCEVYTGNGWDAEVCPDTSGVLTTHPVAGGQVVIRTALPPEFPYKHPECRLLNRANYGPVAHVSWGADDGSICIGPSNSFHLNYSNPEAVAVDGLEKAVAIVSRALTDKDWNRSELLREFAANWLFVAYSGPGIILMAEADGTAIQLHTKQPDAESKHPADGKILLVAGDSPVGKDHALRKREEGRREQGKGLLLPLLVLIPPPLPGSDLAMWWAEILDAQPKETKKLCRDAARHTKVRDIYVVVHVVTAHGPTWFALRARSEEKKRAPVSLDELDGWTFEAKRIDSVISKESLLPRGGASVSLQGHKVCVVGCGSVGGYIADMLASSGIGELTLVDHDLFLPENLHRHHLDGHSLYYGKAMALALHLNVKYPYVHAASKGDRLEPLLEAGTLTAFDAVVLATGDVTLERRTSEMLRADAGCPILVSAWVDAYGVGGHAIASLPGEPGCLSCIYHDAETGDLNLYPHLSFIAPDQNVMTSHAGCGSEYIAYSNLDARQTATIAARLALRALSGDLSEGVTVSWRGPQDLARKHGVQVSARYHDENRTMQEIPLQRGGCRVCG